MLRLSVLQSESVPTELFLGGCRVCTVIISPVLVHWSDGHQLVCGPLVRICHNVAEECYNFEVLTQR